MGFYTLSFNALAGGAYIGQNIGVDFYNGGTWGWETICG
jgi:hypothetical protein